MSATSATKQAETYLEALADDLAVSETRYEQAERSYRSFGDWLHRDDSSLRPYAPEVYVQGSFRLGTTIKPLSGEEEYDVDSVCELQALTVGQLSQKKLKEMLGVEVAAYHRAQNMTKPIREGRRCWVLNYADGAQFHMDIVPCVPDADAQRRVMEMANVSTLWSETAVAITDNERANYGIVDPDWCRSNPKAYSEWFRTRMILQLQKRKRILAEAGAAFASVEDIPDYRVRTPLQSAIMILKRHRDLRFNGNVEDRPISIILTTLAAHAYGGEETIGEALNSILSRMGQYVLHDGRKYVIANPTNPLENFADKWETHPHRAEAFFTWLRQAQADFAYASGLTDARTITESIAPVMGRELAEAAFRKTGGGGGLLKAASAAPMTGGLSFPNAPRVPTTKKGFA